MPSVTYRRPWLYAKQREAIFCAERYGVIEASTKSGKTAGCMIWLTEQAMACRPGQSVWWVAPVLSQSKIVFRRLKRAIPRPLYRANETELTITLANDAALHFKGADHPDSLYGEDVYAAVIDEASRVKEDAWFAVRSTLTATNGPVRVIGNVKGRKNWMYRLARKAEAGEPDMHYAKIVAADAVAAGLIDADEVADAERQLPANVFRELYLADASDDDGNPFGLTAIRACIAAAGLADEPAIVFGLDLAKHVDFNVLIGLTVSGAVCHFERWQGSWEDTIARVLRTVGQVPTLVDATGVGDPVVERLQKQGRETGARFLPYKFTPIKKQQLCEGLAVAIQQQAIRYPPGPIVAELESFEYEYREHGVRYTAPSGLHDDCVIGLALAVAQWRTAQPALRLWAAGLGQVDSDAASDVPRPAVDPVIEAALETGGVYWPSR